MKSRFPLLLSALTAITFANVAAAADDYNALTDDEKSLGFKVLFNGKDFKGWKNSGNWIVDDGAMFRSGKGGGLVYENKKIPDNFELRFQWRVGPGSNSGVYYRPGQYEYQILDNTRHVDGRNPRTSAASIYFCMQPSHDATHPVGEWNDGRIVCKGTVVQHWLNGVKVVDLDYSDKQWKFNVDLLRARGGDLKARGANLSFQDHGDPVWYRGIKLREIDAKEKLDQTDITPGKIPDAILDAEKKKLDGIVARRKSAAEKEKAKKGEPKVDPKKKPAKVESK
ncbi:MAG: hypothetical protein ACI9VS_000496 [Candidatus Binatia bacterium]|jgi:hypothetical protein